jgi:hypothetical protein
VVHEPLVDALAVVEVQTRQRAHLFLRFKLVTAHRTNRVINLAVLLRLVASIVVLAELVLERRECNDLGVRQTIPALGLLHIHEEATGKHSISSNALRSNIQDQRTSTCCERSSLIRRSSDRKRSLLWPSAALSSLSSAVDDDVEPSNLR